MSFWCVIPSLRQWEWRLTEWWRERWGLTVLSTEVVDKSWLTVPSISHHIKLHHLAKAHFSEHSPLVVQHIEVHNWSFLFFMLTSRPILKTEQADWREEQYNNCCCSVTKSCPTLCHPMICSTAVFPVLHWLPEFAQTHVHWVDDANEPSHPLSPPSPHALNLCQHPDHFQWVRSSDQVTKLLELQLLHQSFQCIFRVDFL